MIQILVLVFPFSMIHIGVMSTVYILKERLIRNTIITVGLIIWTLFNQEAYSTIIVNLQ